MLPSRIVRTSLLWSLTAALARKLAVGLTTSLSLTSFFSPFAPGGGGGGRYAAAVEVKRGMILIATCAHAIIVRVSWPIRVFLPRNTRKGGDVPSRP